MKILRLLVLPAALSLVACSSGSGINILPKKADYKTSRVERSLEVPPDLTAPEADEAMAVPGVSSSGTAVFSEYSGDRSSPAATSATVLPQSQEARVVRDGDRYWLVMQGAPERVWPRVRDFWTQNGFELQVDDPAIGILETRWAENRADIPQGAIRSFLSKALDNLYSSPTRDKFRVRLERGADADNTEVYLTHKGMEEVLRGTDATPEGTYWRPRPRDPELEVEMLKRMMVFLGVEKQRAEGVVAEPERPQKSEVRRVRAEDGSDYLEISEGFSRAWRTVGLALDRVGFNVQDRNRASGIYYVQYEDPDQQGGEEGLLAKLAFWNAKDSPESTVFQVRVQSAGEASRVLVLDREGQRESSGTAERILNLLGEQLQ